MGVFTDHPHTAITERINNIIQESDVEIELELGSLIEIIDLQYSGAIEAARAIRKKLKYGKLGEKSRSLDLLNALVLNGGKNLQEIYNDRKLLERLQLSAVDPEENLKIRKKIIGLAILWNEEFEGDRFHTGIANLKSQLPLKKKKKKSDNHFLDDEAYHSDDDTSTSAGSSSSNNNRSSYNTNSNRPVDPNRKYKIPQINLQRESPKIKLLIAEAASASTDLTNALQSLPPGTRSSSDKKSTALFDKTRIIRRKILRYLQLVDSEEFLGSLINSNEILVNALQLYTEKSIRTDDSDDYSDLSDDSELSGDSDLESVTDSLASTMIEEHERNRRAPPPVPGASKAREQVKRGKQTDDDPFGDDHIVDESADWK